jgi:hypothetical protein
MKQEFVTHEQALALKKIGFNMPVNWFVSVDDVDEIWEGGEYNWNGYTEDKNISLPLKQQVFRWFRNKYRLTGLIEIGTQEYTYQIYDKQGMKELGLDPIKYNGSYEEAELACINNLIQIISDDTREQS